MKLGYFGLGKMGQGMVLRLVEKGHEVIASNRSKEPTEEIAKEGVEVAYSWDEMLEKLDAPRTIWVMVSHQAVDAVLEDMVPKLEKGDTIIDGGNSPYKESVRRARELEEKGIDFLDVGTSGGPGGSRNGACMMIGGKKESFKKYEEIFRDACVDHGYGYMGQSGAGHFVKMVHNGIEYGMMQAIGEGFEIMKKSDFNLDLQAVTDVYSHGSVIESRLVSWLKSGYEEYGVELESISGEVSHSGEGQWTVDTARELNIPAPIIEGALQFRKDSQGNPSYTGQVVSALRNQFGGHDVRKS